MTKLMNSIFEEKYILKTRVKAGLKQTHFADAFNVSASTYGKHERNQSPLYLHAVNGFVWHKDPLVFIKRMVKEGRAPECMVNAYQEWLSSHAKNA